MYECEICGARLDAGEACDCKKNSVSDNSLTVKIEPFSPISKIVFNKEELIERAQAAVGEYANILVTAENLKEMKAKKAEFNKVIKALDTERIKQKKLFTEPVTAFEKDVKEVISVLATAVTNIDGQIKKIDEQEKEEKQHALKKYFDEKGIEFSGGESQKISCARANYRNTDIIILDEPTASRDPVSEQQLYKRFNDIIGKKTTIYITHRLASVRFCDHVAVLMNGEMIEYGTHKELMDNRNTYYNMFTKQANYYINSLQEEI